MTTTQETPLQPDFRKRAKSNDVAVARLIGFEAKEIAEGRATVTFSAEPRHANPIGTLHGGILCDIAEAAMGMAFATTLVPEESSVIVELKINFFRPAGEARLTAQGWVVQHGRTMGYGECEITDEEKPSGRQSGFRLHSASRPEGRGTVTLPSPELQVSRGAAGLLIPRARYRTDGARSSRPSSLYPRRELPRLGTVASFSPYSPPRRV